MLALAALPSTAQTFPRKPIRFIVNNAAGGAPDTLARMFGQRLAVALDQPIVVENRPAAGGIVANDFVAKSAPDGYTLLVGGTAALAPAVVPDLPYDPIDDLAGIAALANVFAVIITGPAAPFRTLPELVDYGKAHPGKLNFGSAGIGSPTHLSGERLRHAAGFAATHVPQKGALAAVNEVMAGRLDYYIPPLIAALGLIRAGKVVALAVPSERRLELLPEVPTTAELGWPEAGFASGVGLWGPKRMPRDIVARLNREILKIAQSEETRDLLRKQGADPWPMTPEQFDAYIQADSARQQQLVKAARIRPD